MLKREVLDYKLCFIDKDANWAYFTSCDLADQWGDDWSDVPYEHNAGVPYNTHQKIGKNTKHEIMKIAFMGQVEPPCASYTNSYWSVEQINNGDVPWLSNQFFTPDKIDKIYAGTTLREFIDFIRRNEGEVFIPLSTIEDITFEYDEQPIKEKPVFKGEFG